MPDWPSLVRERLAGIVLDPSVEIDVVEELAQHVEDRYRGLRASGVPESEAIAISLQELQDAERLLANLPSRAPSGLLPPIAPATAGAGATMLDDLRFAWRRLRHSPGFTAVAVLTVAFAVGANTAILSIADAVLFRPLPYADADHVFILQMLNRSRGMHFTLVPYRLLQAIKDGHAAVSEVGVLEDGPRIVVATPDGRETLPTLEASASYFTVLGVRPARGRMFDQGDAGGEGRVAVLSYAAWQRRFGGDNSIVGRSVTLGGSTFDIVGVLPANFVFPSVFAGTPALVILKPPIPRDSKGGTFHPIIRLGPGVSRERAQAEIDAAVAPVTMSRGTDAATPVLESVRSILYPVGRPIMGFLLAATGLLLLIGCANLANMLIVRGRRGQREMAVRLALGASRLRVVRPIVLEAVLIGLTGAVVAVVATVETSAALLRVVPRQVYGSAPVGVDVRVVVMALAMGLVSGLAFAAIPAWRATGTDALALLQGRGLRRDKRARLGQPMIALQVGLTVVLAFGAIIAGRAFLSALRVPLGFSPQDVVQIRLTPPPGTSDRQQFYARALEILLRRDDVISAGAGGGLPLSGQAPDDGVYASESPALTAGIVHVMPGYFETVGIPLLRGRLINQDDLRGDMSVAVVSESAARVMFAGQDPLGGSFQNRRGRRFRVVGVVGDVRQSFDRDDPRTAYVVPGADARMLSLVVRMRSRRDAVLPELTRQLDVLVAGQSATASASWWSDSIAMLTAYRNPRFQTLILVTLALLALALTAAGVSGVVGYLVVSRTHEMGIRLAIGATPQSLVSLILRQISVPLVVGLVGGLLVTRLAARLAEAQLFKVDTHDPFTLAVASATVVVAALLAAYLPARRAIRIDPVSVLHAE